MPDDHPLMAGMVGLQTSHRYGNATMLESDFVLGIGNRWANRHTGGLDTYTGAAKFIHVDIEPTQIGRVFAPDYGDRVRRRGGTGAVRRGRAGAGRRDGRCPTAALGQGVPERKQTMQRRTHFDNVPIKPQRVYEEMNRLRARHPLRQHDRVVADRRRAVPARLQAAALDQLRPGRSAGLDVPATLGVASPTRRRPSSRCRATTTSSS